MRFYHQLLFFVVLLFSNHALFASASTNCTASKPALIKPMVDYQIIAHDEISKIDVKPYFKGDKLQYSIVVASHEKKNKIQIKNGVISVDANKNDNFDISVTAKNSCGNAKSKFNVQIDEEV